LVVEGKLFIYLYGTIKFVKKNISQANTRYKSTILRGRKQQVIRIRKKSFSFFLMVDIDVFQYKE
jgi:hypothetical protein